MARLTRTSIPALLTLLACGAALAGGGKWHTDFDQAKAAAKAEKKDLLVDFTGSDWCPPCIRLKQEVFSREVFHEEASKHFVFVELDFPRLKAVPEKIREQNEKLAEAFGVEGFPSVFLTDASGRAYARTGYQPGGPQKYLEHLRELRGHKAARDRALARAAKAEGLERAVLLDEALSRIDEAGALVGYDDVIAEIVKLDAKNEHGLKAKYLTRQRLPEIERLVSSREFDGALKKIEGLEKELAPAGEVKQKLFYLKALVLHNKDDAAGTLAALKTALAAAPGSELSPHIASIIEDLESAGDSEGEPEESEGESGEG